jgi:hypothetical protein
MKVLSDILHKAGILKEGAEAYSSGGYSVVVRNATTQRFETVASTAFANIYTSNGTLTGNRTVTLSGSYLDIAGTTTTRFFSTGNVTVGGTVDAGFKLDVNGEIRGVSRVSASLGGLTNNCLYTYISNHCGSAGYIGFGFVNTTNPALADSVFDIYQGPVAAPIANLFNIKHSLLNASYVQPQAILGITTTINQSATATGDIRGIYYNPTVTSVIGNHFAWESTSGKIKVSDLSGTGSRMVVADSSGVLSTSALPTSTNIYNSDGTLTGNRTVTMGSNTLTFSGTIGFNAFQLGGGQAFLNYSSPNVILDVSGAGWNFEYRRGGGLQYKVWGPTGNFAIGSGTTDSGFKLDVQGTARVTGDALINSLTVGRGNSNISSNVVVGETSGTSFTTGGGNVAIGYRVLTSVTTGINNIGIGYDALRFSTTTRSVGIGFESGYNMTGTDNVGVGQQTLKSTTGFYNVAMGAIALRANTSGSSNVAIGAEALLANTTGGSNTAIGTQALNSNNSSNNVAVGYQTMYSSVASQRSVVIGYTSGFDTTTTDNNLFIGYNTGRGITTGRANTILGSVQGLTSTLSNNIILADGDGNIRIRAFDTGNVTINSGTDAGFKLDVAGTGRFTNMLSVITTGTTNEVALFKSTEPYITVEAAGGSNSASIFLKPSTSSQNATIQNRTGGGLEFYVNADYVNAKMTIKGTTINIRSLPTSASGLSSGDLWNDSGTLKVA